MNNDLERQLRRALRHVDPEEGFAQRVMTRIEGEGRAPRRWLPLALAACAVFGIGTLYAWHEHQESRGLEARQQLMDALRVTGEKLDLAYRAVNAESRPTAADDTGA